MAAQAQQRHGHDFPGADKVKEQMDILKKAETGNLHTPFARGHSFSKNVDEGLYKCIEYSHNVAAMFESMSAFFSRDNVGLPGISLFFKVFAQAERNDYFKVYDFLSKRGAAVHIGPTAAPPSDWSVGKEMSDVTHCFTKALALLKVAVDEAADLEAMACKEKDALAVEFLNCAILEQSEKVRHLSHYLAHLKVVENQKLGIKEFDRRITFEIEDLAWAAGVEAAIPARLLMGTMARARGCQNKALEQSGTMEQELRARYTFNKVV